MGGAELIQVRSCWKGWESHLQSEKEKGDLQESVSKDYKRRETKLHNYWRAYNKPEDKPHGIEKRSYNRERPNQIQSGNCNRQEHNYVQ